MRKFTQFYLKKPQECPVSFGNTVITSITLHPCCLKYLQNAKFAQDKPNSSRSKVTKADEEFSVFQSKNVKLFFPK